jgi:uncharacterized repeat protein (TIGR02543 family)
MMKKAVNSIVLSALVLVIIGFLTGCDALMNALNDIERFQVIYEVNGGTGEVPPSTKWDEGASVMIRSGINMIGPNSASFASWKASHNGYTYKPGQSFVMPNRDVILTAQWNTTGSNNDIEGFQVIYEVNGGTGEVPPSTKWDEGASIMIPPGINMIGPNGASFVSWKASHNGYTYKPGQSFVMPNWDVILTAQWNTTGSNNVNKYSVNFDSNGGSIVIPINGVISGSKILKPADPIKEGCIFKGWFKDEQCTSVWNFNTDPVALDIVLYAKWREIETIAPAEVIEINQTFDWSHNIVISWTEPSDNDFAKVKIYENDQYKTDVLKGTSNYGISSIETETIKIQTVDNLNNVSAGITYTLNWKEDGITRVVVKDGTGAPVSNTTVVGFAANKTIKSSATNDRGAAYLPYTNSQTITFLIAHPSYEGLVNTVSTSTNQSFVFTNNNKGSILAQRGTCYIPGLSGRLNPIKDNLNRLYLYADNIAINGGGQQPVYFDLVNQLTLEDANENVKRIWIPFIDGDTSLINYSPK